MDNIACVSTVVLGAFGLGLLRLYSVVNEMKHQQEEMERKLLDLASELHQFRSEVDSIRANAGSVPSAEREEASGTSRPIDAPPAVFPPFPGETPFPASLAEAGRPTASAASDAWRPRPRETAVPPPTAVTTSRGPTDYRPKTSPPAAVSPPPPAGDPVAAPTGAAEAFSCSRPSVARRGFDWERTVGVNLFSWIAGIALLLAGGFFVKYSVDHGWLGPAPRTVLGLVVGIAILLFCEWKAARRYPVTANALDAAGIGILYSTLYAAHAYWHLLGLVPAFALLVLVTVCAVVLAVRHDAVFIALLGLLGGFAVPALLSTGVDRPLGLFGYLLLLNGGLAWLARRKDWPFLGLLSLLLTTFYQWAWIQRFLVPEKLATGTAIFLVFALFGLVGLFIDKRPNASSSPGLLARVNQGALLLPLIFALYTAVTPELGQQWALLFGFLFCLAGGLAAAAIFRGPGQLHLAGGAATVTVLVAWLVNAYTSTAWPGLLGWVAGLVGIYLAVPFVAARCRCSLNRAGQAAAYTAPTLLLVFPALAALEPATAEPWLLGGALLVLLGTVSAWAAAHQQGLAHLLGIVMALSTLAVWTGRHLDARRLSVALTLYLAAGVYALVVPLLARRAGKMLNTLPLEPNNAALQADVLGNGAWTALSTWFFLANAALFLSLALPPNPLAAAFLGLLALFFGASLVARLPWLHLAALLLGSTVLWIWLDTIRRQEGNLRQGPAASLWPTVAVAGLLVIAGTGWVGSVWADRRRFAQHHRLAFRLTAFVGLLAGLCSLALTVGVFPVGRVEMYAATLAALVLVLLSQAGGERWAWASVVGAAIAALVPYAWLSHYLFEPRPWPDGFLLAAASAGPFLLYPIVIGKRGKDSRMPALAAVIATAAVFLFLWNLLDYLDLKACIGLLPLTLAGFLALVLMTLLRLEPPGARDLGRLALVSAALLAFITIAVPLQFEKEWLTLGWALEGAALLALYRWRLPHPGLVGLASGLFVAAFVRLVFNPFIFDYHPACSMLIFNWFLYAYLVVAAALFAGARLVKGTLGNWPLDPRITRFRLAGLFAGLGTVLLFLLLNLEITDYFAERCTNGFYRLHGSLAQDLVYTLGWALFGLALLVVGVAQRTRVSRIAALGLLLVTVFKAFLHDLSQLAGLYRVGSFVGLAVCLALVAVLVQRYVLNRQ